MHVELEELRDAVNAYIVMLSLTEDTNTVVIDDQNYRLICKYPSTTINMVDIRKFNKIRLSIKMKFVEKEELDNIIDIVKRIKKNLLPNKYCSYNYNYKDVNWYNDEFHRIDINLEIGTKRDTKIYFKSLVGGI